MLRSIVIALFLFVPSAWAETPFDQAKALNARGRAMLDAGDPGGALAVFEQAYTLSPSPTLLLNIGTALKRLGRNAAAANSYQHYLDEPNVDPWRATEVRTLLATLDGGVGKLVIETVASAEVQVGDAMWLPAPRARVLRVEPGTYVLHVRNGDRVVEATGRVEAGQERHHAFAFTEPAAAPPAPRTVLQFRDYEEPARRPRGSTRVVPFVLAGAGVAALATSVYLGYRAHEGFARAEELCGAGCTEPVFGASRDAADAATRDRWWALGVGGAGAAMLGVATYLFVRRDPDARPVTTALAVRCGVLLVHGSW